MSIWNSRDLPVLEWLAETSSDRDYISTNRLSDRPHPELTTLTEIEVHVSIETLIEAGLLSGSEPLFESGGGVMWVGLRVSGRGLQTLGEWPAFETLENPEELASLLEALAELAASDEEEESLKSAAQTVRLKAPGVVRGFASAALQALARSQLGV